MQERRRDERHETALRAEVRGQGPPVAGEVRNLSLEGAGLALSEAVAPGAVVLALALVDDEGHADPGDAPLELPATVVWTAEVSERRWAAGLRFADVDAAVQLRLERFLDALDE